MQRRSNDGLNHFHFLLFSFVYNNNLLGILVNYPFGSVDHLA